MSSTAHTRILLVDSHPISLTGLRTILDSYPDLRVVGVVQEGAAVAATLYAQLRPDVVIVSAHTHSSEAVEALDALSRSHPPLPAPNTLVLINNVDAAAGQVLQAGVKGLLSSRSSSKELAAAVRIMATGHSLLIPTARNGEGDSPLGRLTGRETEVFRLMTRGYSNAEISEALTLSQSTVKSHIQRVMEKLGLRNRVHAVIYAYEKNIIQAPS